MTHPSIPDAKQDPFVWPYRAGRMGPMGNSPKDVRDYTRWKDSATEIEVVEVQSTRGINLYGYPGIVTDTLVNLEDNR